MGLPRSSHGARRLLAATPKPQRDIVGTALFTGLRAGSELISLLIVDVHLTHRTPHIVVRFGGEELDADEERQAACRLRRTRTPPSIFERGSNGSSSRRRSATRPDVIRSISSSPGSAYGGSRSEEHVLRWDAWKAILKKAKLENRSFRWHDLRHTCASSLVSGWWGRRWSIQEVQRVLGHADVTTTMRYAHLADDAVADAARAAGTAIQLATNLASAIFER